MGKNTDGMIKASISECIVEELFRDLGFFVLKLGQEHTVSPLTQLQQFIKSCGGKFKLNKDEIEHITILKKLPDFVVVDEQGILRFVEVKFSETAQLNKRKLEVFRFFPDCAVLVVNLLVKDTLYYGDEIEEQIDEKTMQRLRKTRFHVWVGGMDTIEDGESMGGFTLTLEDWLKGVFNIEGGEIIKEYEDVLKKWIPKSERHK